MEFASLKRVREEAARSLADMAKDILAQDGKAAHAFAIAVRDDGGPVLHAKLTFEIEPRREE